MFGIIKDSPIEPSITVMVPRGHPRPFDHEQVLRFIRMSFLKELHNILNEKEIDYVQNIHS